MTFRLPLRPRHPCPGPPKNCPRGGYGTSNSGLDGTATAKRRSGQRGAPPSTPPSRCGLAHVGTSLDGMNIQDVRLAPRSPWQKAYVERLIGDPGECLDRDRGEAAGLYCALTHRVQLALAQTSRRLGRTHRSHPWQRHRPGNCRHTASQRSTPQLRPNRCIAVVRPRRRYSLSLSLLRCTLLCCRERCCRWCIPARIVGRSQKRITRGLPAVLATSSSY